MSSLSLRHCGPADAAALERLAGRDSAAPLTGAVLAAEADGELLAAISLDDGRVIADPFAHTAALVDLLRTRAAQLSVDDGGGRRPRLGVAPLAAGLRFGR